MLKKISLVLLLSTFILSCNKNEMNPVDAVDKSTPKAASKPRSFDSKAITGADSFTLVNTGCSSEPTLYNAASWYIPGSDSYKMYATGGVIAGSQYITRAGRLPDVYPPNRYMSLGVISVSDSYRSYVIRNIQVRVNNNGTVDPGIYYSNVPDSFVISWGTANVWNNTGGYTPVNTQTLSEKYPEYFTENHVFHDNTGNSVPSSDWFLKINNCSVSFEGCKRKISMNYELYVKKLSGEFIRFFPSSYTGLSVD